MFSLIVIAITIVTLAALSVVAINYTPRWAPTAQLTHELAADGFVRLEKAFELASAAQASEQPPVPDGSSDGGLQANFRAHYGFLPKAPQGVSWSYGVSAVSGPFQNMHYFCLSGSEVGEGVYVGLERLARTLGPGQAVLGASCGANASAAPSAYPAAIALTYYVQFVPEVQ
jgi:hypothetical protein